MLTRLWIWSVAKVHLRYNPPWCDGVDPNAIVNKLTGHCLGNRNQASFDGVIDHLTGPAEKPSLGGKIDNGSALFLQQRQQHLRHQHPATQADPCFDFPIGQPPPIFNMAYS